MGKLAAMAKLMKGVTSPEDLLDILEGMGVNVTFKEVPLEAKVATSELEEVIAPALEPGNKLFALKAVSEEGHKITAFVVMHGKPELQLEPSKATEVKKLLDTTCSTA